ncbi:hypothetical protein KJ657_04000 [Patescibacteria group bacterium]|nr:hypothetical protein [Patescibacteria group bacterium]MBU1016227.1 hypothetical protein [Patescibacteria group bacterium]
MSSLTFLEKNNFEKLFGMNSGYVLDFTNRTFHEFFADSAKINIYDDKYNNGSGSKANRLRVFWQLEPDNIVAKSLKDLLDYWISTKEEVSTQDKSIFNQCKKATERLLGHAVKFTDDNSSEISETEFIHKEFKGISIDKLDLDGVITGILKQRMDEIRKCLNSKSPLATIFLCGSVLEGVLLGIATRQPKLFSESTASPKDKKTGKVKQFDQWSLGNFIDVAFELNLIQLDVKKFSHSLRDFRNYIHPYQQAVSNFDPSQHTSKICWQVLQAVIFQLTK